MTVVTRCWWIRHAPVIDNGGRIYGQQDIAADVSDGAPFAALAPLLPDNAVWVASHLQRTHQTADALGKAGAAPTPLVVERDLSEQSFGIWQGQVRDEIFSAHGEWHRFWIAPAHTAPPGGESFADLIDRVVPAIERLLAAHAGRDIVIVAHGGTIRAAIAHALGIDPQTAIAFSIDNLSLTRLDHIAGPEPGHGAWRIVAINRIPH
ncbi:MAG: histidine phosphatase family protein [Alphaproteobacteria bacterium]|nr:histidine phosphatase family protein [Alphaproteobacteria bacterium]